MPPLKKCCRLVGLRLRRGSVQEEEETSARQGREVWRRFLPSNPTTRCRREDAGRRAEEERQEDARAKARKQARGRARQEEGEEVALLMSWLLLLLPGCTCLPRNDHPQTLMPHAPHTLTTPSTLLCTSAQIRGPAVLPPWRPSCRRRTAALPAPARKHLSSP